MAMFFVDSGSGMCKAGIARFTSLAMCSLSLFAGPDARHRGWYGQEGLPRRDAVIDMPVVCNDRCHGGYSAENCGFSAVQLTIKVVNIPVVVQRPIFMQTTEIPLHAVRFQVVDVPVVWTCRFSGAVVQETVVLP